MRHVNGLVAVAALVASSVSCGDVVRSGKAPMFLVIDLMQGQRGGGSGNTLGNPLQSDVLSLVTTPAPCTTDSPCPTVFNDVGQVVLRIVPKDIGNAAVPAAPSTNNEVTVNRFRVVYRRADGRNTPGVDVPYGFDGAVTGTVQIGSQLTLGFELVRHSAKLEAPLANLVSNITILTTIADVTFYGQDRVGNEISVTGSIQIDFANYGG
jgi:hypothetical protein